MFFAVLVSSSWLASSDLRWLLPMQAYVRYKYRSPSQSFSVSVAYMTPATPSHLALPYQAFLRNQETLFYYCVLRKILKPMGRLQASRPSGGVSGRISLKLLPKWTCGAYLLETTPNRLPCTSQSLDCRLLVGATCGIQGGHESVLAQRKQGVHLLNPLASLGKHKVAFGPRLAPHPPPGDAPRSLATDRL
ncbi:hypothetical protein RB195_018900 [Necator americanus]|uniref:Secreted protein n=1 Tax=Necator americanus TaxID=51031 RepID=A0ABR1CEF4_NECAM